MQPRHDAQTQEELEFEIGVLSSLVAGLDERDDNVLNAIQNLLERVHSCEAFGQDCSQAIEKALKAIEEVLNRDADFDLAYKVLSDSVDLIYESSALDGGTNSSPEVSPSDNPQSEGLVFDADNPELGDFVYEAEECLTLAEIALLELEKNPFSREHIDEVFRCFHNIKGIAGFLSLTDFQELSHSAEWLMDSVRAGQVELSGPRSQVVFDSVDMLRTMLVAVKEAMAGKEYAKPVGFSELIDRLKNVDEGRSDSQAAQTMTGSSSSSKPPNQPEGNPHTTAKKPDEVLRVATTRLDALIDSVGELVIANGMVQQEASFQDKSGSKLVANVQRLGKIVRELQEQAMGLRMVSLEGTFRKLARVARDLSVKSNTPISFTFEGEETELDRTVVDEMQNPLVHMIRNSVDHGIEPPHERARLGKSENGNLHVKAFHKGGNVIISVQDDGRGLDKQKVLTKAISRGLVEPGIELSEKEIYELILKPGFSTNEQVTEISGRGVGMDVVKKSVEKLRGRLEIQSKPKLGTTFNIYLPLTMAVIDGMVITVGQQKMIIPSIAIQESFRPTRNQLHTVKQKGEMVGIRGDILPMFRLYQLFGISNGKEEATEALVLVITDGENRCGLLVDDLLGQQQVVVKPIGELFSHISAVSGASIMGDGSVALILDTAGVLRMAQVTR